MRIRLELKNELTGLETVLDLEEDIPSGTTDEEFLRRVDLARVFTATLKEQVEAIVAQDYFEGRVAQFRELVNQSELRTSGRLQQLESNVRTLDDGCSQATKQLAANSNALSLLCTSLSALETSTLGLRNRLNTLSKRKSVRSKPTKAQRPASAKPK